MSLPLRSCRAPVLRRCILVGLPLILTFAYLVLPASAQTPHWFMLRPGGRAPQPLQWAADGYDRSNNRLLVFGGTDQTVDYNELWELGLEKDNETWDLKRPRGQAPVYRNHSAAAYDQAGERLVIFGGYGRDRDIYFDETWLLEFAQASGEWSRVARSGTRPAGRDGATLVYQHLDDDVSPVRRMILYGGYNSTGAFNDVWEFNLLPGQEGWSQIEPSGASPVARDSHVAVYDSRNRRMVVFGGWASQRNDITLDDTWALDLEPGSERWIRLDPSGRTPFPMAWGSAVYDSCPGHERMLMFGGYTGNRSSSDTWSLSLSTAGAETWTLLDTTGAKPRPRDSNVIAFDEPSRRLVIYGGWDGSGNLMRDTWALELPSCAAPTPTTPVATASEATPSATASEATPSATASEATPGATASEATPSATALEATTAPCADQYEVDDQWFQAKLLQPGEAAQSRNLHRPGDVDYAKFVADGGVTYAIRTHGLAAGVDTRLHLYDTDGQSLLTWNDDDPTDPPASRIDWECTVSGTYFVSASHLDPGAGGCDLSYSLELTTHGGATPTAPPRLGPIYLPILINGVLSPMATATPDTAICDPGFELGRFGSVAAAGRSETKLVAPSSGAPRPPGSGPAVSAPSPAEAGPAGPNAATYVEPGPPGAVQELSASDAAKLDTTFLMIVDRLSMQPAPERLSGAGGPALAYGVPLPSGAAAPIVPRRISGSTNLRMLVTTSDIRALERLGARVVTHLGEVAVAVARAELLDDLARLPSVVKIEPPRPHAATNDRGRADARVPAAVGTYGVTGKGIIVAVIDTGIDFAHPTFLDANGKTRIKALLDLADPGDRDGDGDLDGTGPGGGTLYTQADIDRSLQERASGSTRVHRWTEGPLTIPNKMVARSQLEVLGPESLTIQSLALRLSIKHYDLEDISITLVSPTGTIRSLPAFTAAASVSEFQATFLVSGLMGTTTAGTWTLEIRDKTEGNWDASLISWALHVNQTVRQYDLDGYGTHVAGTAAGDGSPVGSSTIGQYAGVAPEADILVVRASRVLDVGGHSFSSDDMIAAVQWVDSYARSQGKPYAANLSIGGQYGPHDGTQPHERAFDALDGAGKPGKAVIIANGNDGGTNIHAGGQFAAGQEAL